VLRPSGRALQGFLQRYALNKKWFYFYGARPPQLLPQRLEALHAAAHRSAAPLHPSCLHLGRGWAAWDSVARLLGLPASAFALSAARGVRAGATCFFAYLYVRPLIRRGLGSASECAPRSRARPCYVARRVERGSLRPGARRAAAHAPARARGAPSARARARAHCSSPPARARAQGLHQLLRGVHRLAVLRGLPAPAQLPGAGHRCPHRPLDAAHHLPAVPAGAGPGHHRCHARILVDWGVGLSRGSGRRSSVRRATTNRRTPLVVGSLTRRSQNQADSFRLAFKQQCRAQAAGRPVGTRRHFVSDSGAPYATRISGA